MHRVVLPPFVGVDDTGNKLAEPSGTGTLIRADSINSMGTRIAFNG